MSHIMMPPPRFSRIYHIQVKTHKLTIMHAGIAPDFELCRAIKEKGKPTGKYEVLEPSMVLRDSGLAGWEVLFLQFRDRATGELLPIIYTLPSMYDEEDEPPQPRATETTTSPANKGKRKAEDLDED
ncbi:hypothetical protein BDZ97DRAFT_1841751 [Flammula alnicola]|nr:hypothetical protein BDZ97DRAFT_1841751 [Flammula alnicola]